MGSAYMCGLLGDFLKDAACVLFGKWSNPNVKITITITIIIIRGHRNHAIVIKKIKLGIKLEIAQSHAYIGESKY